MKGEGGTRRYVLIVGGDRGVTQREKARKDK